MYMLNAKSHRLKTAKPARKLYDAHQEQEPPVMISLPLNVEERALYG
jgi:hypothetical protein